ncbi:MAG: hypothetical protein KBB52_04760 [Candidatus Omnitrophica bacterium]|nr:hypothetical protein [Candidatus Omnitrophota bacterium]
MHDYAWAAKAPGELTSVGSDRGDGPSLSGDAQKDVNPETITIPDYLGTIRDAWTPGKYALASSKDIFLKPPQKIIIHIQDAHCNYEGQHKISQILDYINKEYGVKSVNLEGGAKSYNLSPLTSITEAEIRQRVSDYFVKNGRVNGAEYFAINNPGKINLWGLEDTRLYVANLEIYRASLKYKREVDKLLGNLSYILTNLKIKIYNRELLEFDSKYIQYKAGNLEFKEYLSYILAKAKEKGLELEPRASLRLLEKALLEEPNIDFKKANIERDRFVDALKNKLSSRTLDELIAKTAQFKNGRVSQKDFYDFLIEKAKVVNVNTGSYPELKKYVDYVSTYNSVDKMKVMVEIAELESKLKDAMIENDTQRKLDLLSKNLVLLKNVFNISLSKDDYKYFVSNKDSFDMRHYIAFIEKEAPRHNIVAKLEEGISDVDGYREDMAKFYEYSMKRDEAFLKNLKYERTSGKNDASQEIAVMVTGGFHSENLAEHFRKNNIAYVSIMPNFRNNEGYKAPYMDLLAGQETQVERAIDAALSSMQIYDYLTELGIAVDGERGLRRWLLSVAIVTAVEKGQDYIIQTPFERIRFYKDAETGDIKYEVTKSDRKDAATYNAVINDIDDIGPLLYETHQEVIDRKLEEAYRDGKTARAKDADIDAVAEFFEDKNGLNRSDLAQALLTLQRKGMINIIGKDIDGFKGHAGARGIHISENADIRAALAHEAAAYFYDLGHDFNDRIEKSYLAYTANPKDPKYPIGTSPESLRVELSTSRLSPIGERAMRDRTRTGRDYAMPDAESLKMTSEMLPVYNELDMLLQNTQLWRDNLSDTKKLFALQKELRSAVARLYANAKASLPAGLLDDPLASKVMAYIILARSKDSSYSDMAKTAAKSFETFCLKNNIALAQALQIIYSPEDVTRFRQAIDAGGFEGASIQGFSRSLFAIPNEGIQYLSVLSGMIGLYGIDSFRAAMGNPERADQFGWLIVNPSYAQRRYVRGIAIAADNELLEAAGNGTGNWITPRDPPILTTRTMPPVRYDRSRVELIRDSLNAYNVLIDNNSVALLALQSDGRPLEQASLDTILNALELMVMSYKKLIDNAEKMRRKDFNDFNGIDFDAERVEVLAKWDRLKAYFNANRVNLTKDDVQRRIIELREAPSNIDAVNSLHELINFLHGRVMYPIFLITSSPLREGIFADQIVLKGEPGTLSKTVDIINIEDRPFISNGGISSQPLRDLLAAYSSDQNPETKTQVILNRGMIFGNINIGVHKLEFEYNPNDPDSGGGIKIQYMEYASYSHNILRLRFIEEVLKQLGVIGYKDSIISGRYLTITLNKDTGAISAEDIRDKFINIMRCLLYTQGLEFAIPPSASDEKNGQLTAAASLFIQQQKIHPTDFYDLELGEEMPSEEDDAYDHLSRRQDLVPGSLPESSRAAINARLAELGIKIPETDPQTGAPLLLTQRTISKYVNDPIERRLDLGELVWQNGRLIKNDRYAPVSDMLKEVSAGRMDELINTSEAIYPLLAGTSLENIGIIGRYLIQVGVFKDGLDRYLITAAVNPNTGNIMLSHITKRVDDGFEKLSWEELETLMIRLTGEKPDIQDISAEEAANYLASLKGEWRRAPPGVTIIPCKKASQGERIIDTKITMDKETALKGGYALLAKNTTPEDFEYMASSDAVLTTSGGALSHAGIVCSRELKKPSLIISDAVYMLRPDGRGVWLVTSYEPETGTRENIEGFQVFGVRKTDVEISEGSRVIVDGARGRLSLISPEAREGAVSGLTSQVPDSAQSSPSRALTPRAFEANPALESQPITLFRNLRAGDGAISGPKNANLGELQNLTENVLKNIGIKYGFSVGVPDGFSVNTAFFSDMLGTIPVLDSRTGQRIPLKSAVENTINDDRIASGEKEPLIKGYLEQAKISAEASSLREKIDSALKEMGGDSAQLFWAVRSSSIDEDSAAASFAGMGNTYLFIPTSMLLDRIIDNYSSIATERSLEYRAARAEGGKAFGIGDIRHATGIQTMVNDPDAAGVIFTKNPANNSDDEIMINASYGLGEPVVNGSVDPDAYVVNKYTGRLAEGRYFGHKLTKVVAKQGGFGTIALPMPDGKYRSAFGANWRQIVEMLAEVAKNIEEFYGRSMDIEFAIKDSKLYILQARPITDAMVSSKEKTDGTKAPRIKSGGDAAYLAGLRAKELSETSKTEIDKAQPVYEGVQNSLRTIVDIMNKGANTYVISPAPVGDYSKTMEWANKLRQGMGKNGNKLRADYYTFGNGEDWLNGSRGLISRLDNILDEFLNNTFKQISDRGISTDRLCIRVIDRAGRESVLRHLDKNARILSLSENERRAVMSRIRVEVVDIGLSEHLNPMPDLLTDILTMEFDRYIQNDYKKESIPAGLIEQLGNMLQLTTDNINPEMVTKEAIEDTVRKLFEGELMLKIRPIDWKSIDEWRDRNNAVAIAA